MHVCMILASIRVKSALKTKQTNEQYNKQCCFGSSMSLSPLNCKRVFFNSIRFEFCRWLCVCVCICAESSVWKKRSELTTLNSLARLEIWWQCVRSLDVTFFLLSSSSFSSSHSKCISEPSMVRCDAVWIWESFVPVFSSLQSHKNQNSHHQGNKQHKSTFNEWKIPRRQWKYSHAIIKKKLKRNETRRNKKKNETILNERMQDTHLHVCVSTVDRPVCVYV